VTVDNRRPTITTTATYGHLSPDADGHVDTSRLAWTSSQPITGAVRIVNASGTTVRSWSVADQRSWAATWDGRDGAGTVVPDGRYTYRVDGRDRAANRSVVDRSLLVDRTLKSHRWSDGSFDPRDRESSRMTVSLRRSADVTATIYLGSSVVRRIWSDRTLAAGSYGWTWNGRTSSGAYAKAGKYRVVVSATSRFGTTRWTRYVTIEAH
jgi:flagellar hook assembly protein FlgD